MESFDSLLECDDVLVGPITKREILVRLKCQNLLNPEFVEPLKLYEMDDPLDASKLAFYEEILEIQSDPFENMEGEEISSQIISNKQIPSEYDGHMDNFNNSERSKDKNVSEIINIINSSDCNNLSSLNDTLDEMEMLMKFGLSYMAEENSMSENTSFKQVEEKASKDIKSNNEMIITTPKAQFCTSTEDTIKSNNKIITITPKSLNSSFSKLMIHSDPKNLSDNSCEEITEENSCNLIKTNCVQKNTNDKNAVPTTSNLPSNSPILKPVNYAENNFKVPGKLLSTKAKSPQVKNVASPIGLYIKNSPTVPLIRNVFQKPEIVLPTRKYQPSSRKVLLSNENEPALPSNVRKLIKGSLNPEIIKHVRKVQATQVNSTSISDVSLTSDTSSSEDISVLISKNAIRTHTLKTNGKH